MKYRLIFAIVVLVAFNLPVPLSALQAQANVPLASAQPLPNSAWTIFGRGQPRDVTWNPKGSTFAVSSRSGIWVYTGDLKDVAHLPTGSNCAIESLRWLSDGYRLAGYTTCGPTFNLYSWDVRAPTDVTEHSEALDVGVDRVVWRPDNQRLAVQFDDKTVVVLDVPTGVVLDRFKLTSQIISAQAWQPDGSNLLTIDQCDQLVIVDLNSERAKTVATGLGDFNNALWSTDGKYIVIQAGTRYTENCKVTSQRYAIQVWNFAHLNAPVSQLEDSGEITWRPGYDQFVVVNPDSLWTFTVTPTQVTSDGGPIPFPMSLYWDVDGEHLLVTEDHGLIYRWSFDALSHGQPPVEYLAKHVIDASAAAWSSDRKRLATINADAVFVWDAATQQIIRWWTTGTIPDSLAWNADNSLLAVDTSLWDPATGMLARDLTTQGTFSDGFDALCYPYRCPTRIAWSPDGSRFAAQPCPITSETVGICVWNPLTGILVRTLPDSDWQVAGLTWAPDGRRLIGSSTAWNTDDWTPDTVIQTLIQDSIGHSKIYSKALSPDGQRLAVSTWNGPAVYVFNLTTNSLATRWSTDIDLAVENHMANMQWSPDGIHLIGLVADNAPVSVMEYDALTGRPIGDIGGCSGSNVYGTGPACADDVRWTPDGSQIVLLYRFFPEYS